MTEVKQHVKKNKEIKATVSC